MREGGLSRETALGLVKEENRPRYESIKWYLDAVGINFSEAIRVINGIPKLYELESAVGSFVSSGSPPRLSRRTQ